jgi:adenylosuccinate synthase
MSELNVVVGAQFGSEGKGAVSGWLTAYKQNAGKETICVRVAGPNAGHTVIGRGPDGKDGYAWKLRTVPVAAVSNPEATLVIAAGSEIELAVLNEELNALDKAGYDATRRLLIDGEATVLTEVHKDRERLDDLVARVGSTGKGIGAARADRLMRSAPLYRSVEGPVPPSKTAHFLGQMLSHEWTNIVIEGTQGYGLGLHAGHYPQCTSSDCRAVDFLSMAGISPWHHGVQRFMVWAVARCFPIRVAGNSGPLEGETSWEQLGLPEERTTVTNLVRRVGEWDAQLVRDAVEANGGTPYVSLALTMLDQKFPEMAGRSGEVELQQLPMEVQQFIAQVESDAKAPVVLIGTGPDSMLEVVL